MKTTKNAEVSLYKSDVELMSDYLKSAGYDIKHTHLIEASARFCGVRDWRTLRSELVNKSSIASSSIPNLDGKSVRVYMEVHACDEYGESPRYCWIDIDQLWVDRAFNLRETCLKKDISSVEDGFQSPNWIDPCNDFRIQYGCIHLTKDRFWFQGSPKHCDYNVETYIFDIDDVIRMVKECKRSELFLFQDKETVDDLMEGLDRIETDDLFVSSDEEDCIPVF
jgi:hypothetical protein